jgi:hypothetical protein
MAERPVFVPLREGRLTVSEVPVAFAWNPGMAAVQKRRNVAALHAAAAARGMDRLLEVSTKSDRLIGRRLSAFHQQIELAAGRFPLESVYHGCKVFERGGPFADLFALPPRDAKRDARLSESGRLVAFELEGRRYPLDPPTAFYDWLYLRCIYPERAWLARLDTLDGFTDIEFNPARSVNCQARSCALFVALRARAALDDAVASFDGLVAAQAGGL